MEAFNIEFVGVIKKHPILYDFTLMEYSRKDLKDMAWRDVAEEVSLSVKECKEKWKNIRTVFLRWLKGTPNSSKPKIYYLHEALQFILPFTKDLGAQSVLTPESVDNGSLTPHLPPAAPTSRRITCSQHSMSLSQEQWDNTLPKSRQLSQSEPSLKQPRGKKRNVITSESDVDRAVSEYFATKMKPLDSKDERKEGILQFLNSLIPDLLTLTDPQLRSFKRRTLVLIDEIVGTPPLEYVYGPSCPTLSHDRFSETPSPTSTYLQGSSYDSSAPTTPQVEITPSIAN